MEANAHPFLLSLTGKQVVEVPSAIIGNFENVLAICHRGVEIQKVNVFQIRLVSSHTSR